MIIKCTCKHKYQDEKYGPGMRVANAKAVSGNGVTMHRCTVCGLVHGEPAKKA